MCQEFWRMRTLSRVRAAAGDPPRNHSRQRPSVACRSARPARNVNARNPDHRRGHRILIGPFAPCTGKDPRASGFAGANRGAIASIDIVCAPALRLRQAPGNSARSAARQPTFGAGRSAPWRRSDQTGNAAAGNRVATINRRRRPPGTDSHVPERHPLLGHTGRFPRTTAINRCRNGVGWLNFRRRKTMLHR